MVIEDEVLRREIIRSEDAEKTRICDLELRTDGRIYLVDVEQTRKEKRKYAVCIDSHLKKLRK
ncbi:hypothetical protein SAMN05216390_104116 [Lachnospiraceae bacterium KH1T2]|nr:hypothetical protein SAMN05216390_104116 [Lachnospiraceae bacterium KH1T2]